MSRHSAHHWPLCQAAGVVGSLAVLLASVAVAAPALAAPRPGPVLIASNPGDHQTVMSVPDHVTLTFDQSLGDSTTVSIAVTGPGPARVDRGPVAVSGGQATIKLRPGLTSGDYMVGYLVARTGGGSVSGSLIFELKAPVPHQKITDPPSAIASAIAALNSPTPTAARHARTRPTAPSSARPAAVAVDPTDARPAWWRRSEVVAVGALALLVLAGLAVFLPGRSGHD